MLSGVRLQHVRSLGDTGRIDFRPITLLLGQNSSGKSTFLRVLPMLRQSIRTRSSAPVLWYGDLVDFGTFEEVLSSFALEREISVSFFFSRIGLSSPYYSSSVRNNPAPLDVEYKLTLNEVDESTRPSRIEIGIGPDHIDIAFDEKGRVVRAAVNHFDMTKTLERSKVVFSLTDLVPQPITEESGIRSAYGGLIRPLALTEHEIFAVLSAHFDRRVSIGTIRTLARRLTYAPGADFRRRLEGLSSPLKSWASVKHAIIYSTGLNGIDRFRSLYLLGILPELLYSVLNQLNITFRDVSYVGPSRATGERYYRHQELAVDQIDPQGRNLAMFLFSLPREQREQFSAWLEAEIGYSVRVGRQGGHVQVELRERGAENFHNLADMGYGFSQILPVMAQIWSRDRRRVAPSQGHIIAIEQPELHLHPAYQARIADVLANAVTRRSRPAARTVFLVETHSEALVNRLGEMIYDGKLSASDVVIYLFHRSTSTDSSEISRATFDANGILQDWPLGFFSSKASI